MKRITMICIVLLLILGGVSSVSAQEEGASKYSTLSLGYTLYNIDKEFGHGFILTSPYFFNDRMAVRFSLNQSLYKGIPLGKTDYEWLPYSVYKLGVIGVSGGIADSFRYYGEGGVVYAVPNNQFSENNVSGGYGNFGFEFINNDNASPIPFSYFIELGGIGTGAKAEKITGKPFYLNGFTTSTGLRFYF
ncbi:MAG TPA: hypothetical protein VHY08_25370 [Bacillota bacterium]|nr:hypothetical protein [Bacillota bacterium]